MTLMVVLVCANFVSCSNDDENIPVISDEFIDVPLQIKTNFSVDITDEPINRSTAEQPVYAIDVLEINPNTSQTSSYAFGFFKSIGNLSIKLNKYKKYVIKAALYYNYFDKNQFYSTDTKTYTYYKTYTDNFIYISEGFFYGIDAWHMPNTEYSTNEFIEGDGFYGINQEFSPSTNQTCSIDLERISSAVEVIIEGLTEGSAKCVLNSPYQGSELEYQITTSAATLSKKFTYRHLISSEKANVRLFVTYVPTEGDNIELISDSYEFSRGMRKRFLIKLEKKESEDTSVGFKLTLAESEFVDEEQSIHNCVIE